MDPKTDLRENLQPATRSQAVSLRAVALGILLVIVLCVVTPYTDLVMQTSLIACNHLPIGVLTLFVFVIALINPVLRRLPLKRPFSPAELLTIYLMMLVAAGIPSFGLAAYLFPVVTAPFYFATPETTLQQYIPKWFGPRDDYAISRFYEGLKPGETIPWAVWVKPLLGWSVFVIALYVVILCLASILRKQWVDRERLAFPLVQLPLEMVRGEGAPGGNLFLRNKLVWVGVLIPAVVHTINGMHAFYPSVPEIGLKWIEITAGLAGHPPWSALRTLYVFVYFSVIGFAYMLSAEVGLSLWLFHIIYKLQCVGAAAMGYIEPGSGFLTLADFTHYQSAGAVLVVVCSIVWMARRHLGDVVRGAMAPSARTQDADEPLSYRAAFQGLIIGSIVLIGWLWKAGMNPLLGVALMILLYAIMITLAKFVAESGLLFVQTGFRPGDLVASAVGTGPLGAANITMMNVVQIIFMYDLRSYLMPSAMDGFRLADGSRLRRRSVLKAMALAIVVGLVVSYLSVLLWTYRTGGLRMHSWFFLDGNRIPYASAMSAILNPTGPNWSNLSFTGVGAVVCTVLTVLRQRYMGWPLHPIGYAMGTTYPVSQLWFSIMVGWMLKGFLLRYGGRTLYTRARPIFLGLILGEFGVAGLWVLVDMILGVQRHAIFPN